MNRYQSIYIRLTHSTKNVFDKSRNISEGSSLKEVALVIYLKYFKE